MGWAFWLWGFLLEQYRFVCIPDTGPWRHPILVPIIVSALWPAVYAINVLRWLLRIP